MLLRLVDIIYEIDDVYAVYSPYFSALTTTDLPVVVIDNAYVLDDNIITYYGLEQYILFLQGDNFDMNEEVEMVFDYMGHSNIYRYPLDFWRVKLRDTWIRDNFYRLELGKKDPYYGLTKIEYNITRARSITSSLEYHGLYYRDGHYVAGGSALYIANITTDYDDIDLFTTNRTVAEKIVDDEIKIDQYTDHYASENAFMFADRHVQLVLRLYSCPSEIVHGFDVGCTGVLYDGEYVWATERALYSITRRVNWLEPDRSSPSYIYRLCKYNNRETQGDVNRRGFKIMLPLIDEVKLNVAAYNDLREKAIAAWLSLKDNVPYQHALLVKPITIRKTILLLYKHTGVKPSRINQMLCGLNPYFFKYGNVDICPGLDVKKVEDLTIDDFGNEYDREMYLMPFEDLEEPRYQHIIYNMMFKCLFYEHYDFLYMAALQLGYKRTNFFPKDLASLLFLQAVYGVNYSFLAKPISDYNTKLRKITSSNQLIWKEQDPMRQLTGTFHPESITDLIAFYKSSPLIADEGNPVITKHYTYYEYHE